MTATHPAAATTSLDPGQGWVFTPRYDPFRDALISLARTNPKARIAEIAGNREIFLTGVAPSGWQYTGDGAIVAYNIALPTDSTRKRVQMRIPVPELLQVLGKVDREGQFKIDHIYDY